MVLSREDQALKAELGEARFAIQRQLELLRPPLGFRGGARRGGPEIVARLERQLKEIEEALAEFGA